MTDLDSETPFLPSLEPPATRDSKSAPDLTDAPTQVRRRGRPPKRPLGREDASLAPLRGHFRKAYDIALPDQRTVAYLQRIVGQRDVPDSATVSVDGDVLTVDWSD